MILSQRVAVVSLLVLGLLVCLPGTASADDVIIDAGTVQAKRADDGTATGTLAMINTGSVGTEIDASIANDAGCQVSAAPSRLEAGRRAEVKLTLGAGCDLKSGATLTLKLSGGISPAEMMVVIDPPKDVRPKWTLLGYSAFIAFGVAVAFFGWLLLVLKGLIEKQASLAAEAAKAARLDNEWLIKTLQLMGLTSPGDKQEGEAPPKLGWKRELAGLGTSWSFKDSWVANTTIGATALIALFASTDVLKAIFTDDATQAIAFMAVSGAVATVFVTVGALVVKLVGKDVSIPTVGGVFLAGTVVIFGSMIQIWGATLQVSSLLHGWPQRLPVLLAGVAITTVVFTYGIRSLRDFVKTGIKAPVSTVPDSLKAAWIVAAALRPNWAEVSLSPRDISGELTSFGLDYSSPSSWRPRLSPVL